MSTVYAELTPALRPVAEDTVRAHLAKLRNEGRIDEQNGRLFCGQSRRW